jgi:DNA-binding transcriptional ArsR family regulator
VRTITAVTEPDTCELLCLDLPKAEAARARQPSPGELEAWAAGAKALADPTRLAVAVALADSGAACVCDLAWVVARDEKLVSHHARALRVAGLATASRQGKMVMYALTDRGRALLAAVAPRAETPA